MSGSAGAGRGDDIPRTNMMIGLRRDFGTIFGVIIDIIRTIWPYLVIFVIAINWYNYVPSAYLEWMGGLQFNGPLSSSNVTGGDVFTFLIVLFLGFCIVLCVPCCCAYYVYGCLNPQSEWSWLYDDLEWDRKRKMKHE